MADMFPAPLPDWVREDPKRGAEVDVYEALERSLPNSYKVFYSFSWVSRKRDGRAWDGESDFVIAHPNGILLLEVKGGAIDRDPRTGKWTSTDRHGQKWNIDPLTQTRDGKYALISKLKSLPAWEGRFVEIGHAVAFPDTTPRNQILPGDMPREIVLFNDDLASMKEKVEGVYRYWAGKDQLRPIGAAGVELLRGVLSPTLRLPRLLAADLRDEDRQIVDLTQHQFLVMETLRWVKRVGIAGCAGSGKTLLAVEKAKRLADEGRETLLVCYNRPLAQFLKSQLPRDSNPTVCTFHEFCALRAAEAGLGLADPETPGLPRSFYEQLMPLTLMEALEARPNRRFDAIVVDEGQDFLSTWWNAVEMANGEGTDGILYVFYDDHQIVFRKACASLPKGLVPVALDKNLRNTVPICTLAGAFYRGDGMDAGGPTGREVELVEVTASSDAIERGLTRALHQLCRDHGIQPNNIAILTGIDPKESVLHRRKSLGEFALARATDRADKAVIFESIARFKGLERPVVILIELETILEDAERLYIGLTRARLHLIIMGQPRTIALMKKTCG
jgi:hypothetical protein